MPYIATLPRSPDSSVGPGLDPVSVQRIASAVGAGQLGAAAVELARDLRSSQPDRPGRGESASEEYAAGLHPLSDQ